MQCFSQLRRLSSVSREKSLYALLEVAPSATASDIKRAFRQVRRRPVLPGCILATAAAGLDFACHCRKRSFTIQISATSVQTAVTLLEFW